MNVLKHYEVPRDALNDKQMRFKAKCLHCPKYISGSLKITSNFITHLKTKHAGTVSLEKGPKMRPNEAMHSGFGESSPAVNYNFKDQTQNRHNPFLREQISPHGATFNTVSPVIDYDTDLMENIKTEEMSIGYTPTNTPVINRKRKLSGSDDVLPGTVAVTPQANTRPVPVLLTSTSYSPSPRTSVTTKKTKPSEPNNAMPDTVAVPPQPISRPVPIVSTATCTCSQNDEDFLFARYLASEIRKVKNQSTRNYLKLSIQKQIFDAQKEEELLRQQHN